MNAGSNRDSMTDPIRRRIVLLSPLVLLAGCDLTPEGSTEKLLRSVQSFNDWVQGKVFDPSKRAPEYSAGELTPETGFRVNGKDDSPPDFDASAWTLSVGGRVTKPGTYTLADLTKLPKVVMNTRHCCVEGWSMIPRWGGTPLAGLLRMSGADTAAKYVSVRCEDDYYTSYDMASALHPQTLLCYEAYDKPLTPDHGAPLRIVMPVKLGYKSAKWISSIEVTNEKTGGYWEDEGYDWFAGI